MTTFAFVGSTRGVTVLSTLVKVSVLLLAISALAILFVKAIHFFNWISEEYLNVFCHEYISV